MEISDVQHDPKTTWRELFPNGRVIYFEGPWTDLDQFCQEIKDEFGFDPRDTTEFSFHCPPEHLDAIYGTERFPVGS